MGIGDDIRPKKKVKKEKNIRSDGRVHSFGLSEKEKKGDEKDDPFSFDPFSLDKKNPHKEERKNQTAEHEEAYSKKLNSTRKQRSPITKWIILLIVVLAALLVWQNFDEITAMYQDFTSNTSNTEDSKTNPYYDNNINIDNEPKDIYEPAAEHNTSTDKINEPSDKEDVGQTKDASADTADSTNSTITVSVLNGNGVQGSAASVRDVLVEAGYSVERVANALKFSYQNTTLFYKTGEKSSAEKIVKTLNDRSCEMFENNSIAETYDVVVVVGVN